MLFFVKGLDAFASAVILSERVLVLGFVELRLFIPMFSFENVD